MLKTFLKASLAKKQFGFKKIRGRLFGFDLDGVLADKPPFISKKCLEWLFKGDSRRLHYRFPRYWWEQLLRRWSHFYLLRPPIKENLLFLKKILAHGGRVCLVSSRYSFLDRETKIWLKKNHLDSVFEQILLNPHNLPPHLFKEEALRLLKPAVYFEDDPEIVAYLHRRLKNTRIVCLDKSTFSRRSRY